MTVKSVITATIFYQAKCIFGELFQRFLKAEEAEAGKNGISPKLGQGRKPEITFLSSKQQIPCPKEPQGHQEKMPEKDFQLSP